LILTAAFPEMRRQTAGSVGNQACAQSGKLAERRPVSIWSGLEFHEAELGRWRCGFAEQPPNSSCISDSSNSHLKKLFETLIPYGSILPVYLFFSKRFQSLQLNPPHTEE
jgi:hypothetical protein